ncbi:MAG: hypothetical protein ACXVNM_01880 [Bacteroidia bacterium]
MEAINEKMITDKIIDGLKKAVVEMEELRVQLALGKAEARDLYEESKKKFNAYIHEAKISLENFKDKATSGASHIKPLLEALQLQLVLGKAETREVFEEQKKIITKSLLELEAIIRKNKTADEYYSKLLMEIEKFKIKLEIIKLRYELKKMGANEEFEEKKHEFLSKLNEIKSKMLGKKAEQKNKWENFHDEITEAYQHLRKAFVH